jgi:hypothetical protein
MFNYQYLFTILKFAILYYLCKHFGIFFGILSMFAILYARYYIILYIFGLEKLTNIDIAIVSEETKYRTNLLAIMLIDDYNEAALTTHFIKALQSIRKFRLMLKKAFFSFYWKEVDMAQVPTRIKAIPGFKSEEDFLAYCQVEMNNFIDIYSELPYTVELASIGPSVDKKGAIIFKIDHIVSDGLGIVTAICAISDNYDIHMFPKIMQANSNIPLLKRIWNFFVLNLSFFIYGPYVLFNTQNFKTDITPFKNLSKPLGDTRIVVSKQYDLATALKRCRELNVTFNDMVLSVVSNMIKQISIEKGFKDVNRLDIMIPIGRACLPKSITDLDMGNYSTGMHVQIPAINNLDSGVTEVSKSLRKQLRNYALANALNNITAFCHEMLPLELVLRLGDNLTRRMDLVCSNLPGPTKQLVFSGCKVRSMFPLPSTGRLKTFIPIVSYNGKYVIVISINEAVDVDKNRLMELIDQELTGFTKAVKID